MFKKIEKALLNILNSQYVVGSVAGLCVLLSLALLSVSVGGGVEGSTVPVLQITFSIAGLICIIRTAYLGDLEMAKAKA